MGRGKGRLRGINIWDVVDGLESLFERIRLISGEFSDKAKVTEDK
jgi:hypothetical protein